MHVLLVSSKAIKPFFKPQLKYEVIVKDLPLYKGVWSYGNHGVAPASKLMS